MPIRRLRCGFALMPPDRHVAVSRKAGQLSHLKSAAHEWTANEAVDAGRKGGLASQAKRRAAKQETTT